MSVRSQLFVPGNREDRFEKACASSAGLVCIDLEDAVGESEKAAARDSVINWLSRTNHEHVSLRINGVDTAHGQVDIEALSQSGLSLPYVMVPKVGSRAELDRLDKRLPAQLGMFFVIIESAMGLVNCHEIFSHPRVSLGMYGVIDYAGEVDCDASWDAHLYARSRCVAAAAAFDVQLFGGPHVNVRDLDDCEATTRKLKGLGIHARSAIHPAQIDRIHAALTPSDTDIIEARRIIEAYEAANGNVVL
ncbi:MAG: CoA ester lyase, partial [Litorimonas sp.]